MEQRTPEWMEARRGRVTASIVGAILGNSPFMTRADAMRSLVRDVLGAEREFTGNVATEWGTQNEAGALVEFQMESGLSVTPAPFVPYEDWAGASPDGWTSDDGLVEVKCPYSQRGAAEPEFKLAEDLPHYHDQMQFQMYCTGKMHTWFYQWAPGGSRLERVAYRPLWALDNLPRLRQFYAEMLAEVADCAEEHLAPKRPEVDTPEAHRMVAEWDDIAEQMERLTERKKDLLADMVELASGRNALIAGRKLTLVERAGSISYGKAIKELCPKADLEKWRGKPSSSWQVR